MLVFGAKLVCMVIEREVNFSAQYRSSMSQSSPFILCRHLLAGRIDDIDIRVTYKAVCLYDFCNIPAEIATIGTGRPTKKLCAVTREPSSCQSNWHLYHVKYTP